jgi:peroxiredoxin Q/BCP
LRGLDVAYFAASVDAQDTNSLDLDFPILSDPSKAVARRYGVLAPSGFTSRWTFYIGKDGRIAAIDKKVSAGSHGDDVVRQLTRMKSEV